MPEPTRAEADRERSNYWPEVDRILAAALELEEGERAAFIAAATAGRPEVAAEVHSLLRASSAAGDFLSSPTQASADLVGSLKPPQLERVGPYRLLEEIGHGGMSVVYRAERDDGHFQKQTAVKLLAAGWMSPAVLRRFASERQILATLDHPHICRLLDGGIASGVPYLVMEFVDGMPLLEYCRREGLNERERLRLFRDICAAVQYAHQHLIVHRDIKPGNVLVTRDGAVKLMDFGIAKVLASGAGSDQTQAGFGAMTPDYASPEQIQGGAVTTQSDVYSLGVLLYELLTGNKPYVAAGKTLGELMQAVNEAQLPRGGLPRELLAIVGEAMAKEPADRYASVSALDDDVARYLSGRPVRAVTPSRWYMLRKWVGRHKIPVLAGSAAAVLILGATVFALWSAAEARRERALAEQRFREVQRLANKVLFEYPFALRQLAASTNLQMRMATDSLQYLDDLARARGSDPEMLLDLAKGYTQIGIILGTPRTSNLGRPDKAIEAYKKARDILEDLLRKDPGLLTARLELASALRRLSQLDKRNARQLAEQSLALWQDAYVRKRDNAILFNIGWAHIRLAELDSQSDHARQAVAFLDKFLAFEPNNVNAVHQEAYAQRLLARAAIERKNAGEALAAAQAAKSLDERARSLLSNRAAYAMEISLDLQWMADSCLQQGHLDAAADLFQQAVEIRRKSFQANRGDEWIQQQLLDGLCWLGWTEERRRDWPAAHATYGEAVQLAPALTAVQQNDAWNTALGFVYGSEGLLLQREGRRAQGCALLARSEPYFRAVRTFEAPEFQTRAAEVARASAECGK